MTARLFTDDQEIIISREYSNGKSLTELAIENGTSKQVISLALKRTKTPKRPNDENTWSKINHSAFSEETPERNYWIGFILADGCIIDRPRRTPAIQLSLAKRDESHVRLLAELCNSTVTFEKNAVKTSFSSRRICTELSRYGIIPRKSGREKVPDELAKDRDFWRGMVDGDGWVSRRYTLGICGTEDVCRSFSVFSNLVVGANINPTKIRMRNCWQTCLHGPKAIDMMNFLYREGDVALRRKVDAVNVILYDRMAKADRMARGVKYSEVA